MVTMYIQGSAKIIDGIGIDIAHVTELDVESMLLAGWALTPQDTISPNDRDKNDRA